ncbi:ABC transporter A family member 7-like [Dioscorea cayenensis subsp. rotundata]|uniref:ABC transporter A family member 7-like n=1 Tax=Dioscorea cayennensis subsp. rotundata TaxID=55577 RepID=A0AB40ARX0_DIOCR|nr:ABC transporter A family member 7-like [Dioscorea cayenensis subsp. rotundata]
MDPMAATSRGAPSAFTQANALLRKNLIFQKRNLKTNIGVVVFPVILCVLLVVLQNMVNHELEKPKNRCGCRCVGVRADGTCEAVCGIEYSTLIQAATCPIPSPPAWPPLLQVPPPGFLATRGASTPFADLPDESCKATHSCFATVLITGLDRTVAESLSGNFFTAVNYSSSNFSDFLSSLSDFVLGTDTHPKYVNFIEPAFVSNHPLYVLQPLCNSNLSLVVPVQLGSVTVAQEVKCVQGLSLWRDSSSAVNYELFKGYQQGNTEKKINSIVTAYDFLNTNVTNFNVSIWYNSTYHDSTAVALKPLVRVKRAINLVSNAYLQWLGGTGVKMQFDFVKEMPKPATQIRLDFSSLLSVLFFTWTLELLFPIMLTYLVYEKQHQLKLMMKMHGLGEGAYWTISYAYFLSLSLFYMLCFVAFGSVIGLKFFTLNYYSLQAVFYFVFINLQIALAFFLAAFFSDVKTATVIGYIYVFGSGLLGAFLLQPFIEDTSFSRNWVLIMEIVPGFSLYRGLYEFSQYSFIGNYMGASGMRWADLNDSDNGMNGILLIMSAEWIVLLLVAYHFDQVASLGVRIRKDPLFFLQHYWMPSTSHLKPSLQPETSKFYVAMERSDVSQERVRVKRLLQEPTAHAIICDNLIKVYRGRDGNPDKFAVRGLSLALPRGECFGMLGPNGAGKTSFINMMIGLTNPTSGTAYVQGLDIRWNMGKIYTSIGVCPQQDLLWETLTGREHLMFYGRLKNLEGDALMQAVEKSLKSVNLFYGGVADKQARKYSGGMKRRLSVAISLIGDPQVVYMDEPSTGLDPASRNNLWNVIKHAKQGRAILLTTHSMEEAEFLCDRLGIFVDGSLQCIGNPRELKARYGGSYIFTMTTSAEEEKEVESLVRQLSPSAIKIYHIPGTQKFELPKQEVRIADVFQAVDKAKKRLSIYAWGLADTTLEDVFIKVARGEESFTVLS